MKEYTVKEGAKLTRNMKKPLSVGFEQVGYLIHTGIATR